MTRLRVGIFAGGRSAEHEVSVASAESVREFYIKQVHADPGKVHVIYNAVDWSQLETTMAAGEFRASVGAPATLS